MLKFRLDSGRPLIARVFASGLYDLLDNWRVRPHRFDEFEPVRRPWEDRDSFLHQCEHNCRQPFGVVIVKWRDPRLSLMLIFEHGPASQCHSLVLSGSSKKGFGGESAPWLVELADTLFDFLGMDYGFACHRDEFEESNMQTTPIAGVEGGCSIQAVGMNWPDCIPGLYWCNFFGDAYFEQGFGSRIEEWAGTTKLRRGVRLMRSPSPETWRGDDDRLASEHLRSLLGPDWFFSKSQGMPARALRTDKSAFRIGSR